MAKAIRVPDPIYEAVTLEADQRDVSRGSVIEDWHKKAKQYDELEDRLR